MHKRTDSPAVQKEDSIDPRDEQRELADELVDDVWSHKYKHVVRLHQNPREEMLYLRALFDDAPVAYIVTDGDFVILDANKAAVQLTRRQPENLIGKPLNVLVNVPDTSAFRRILDEVHSGATVTRPIRLINRSGEQRETSFTARIVRTDDDAPGFIYCMFATRESEQADMI